MKKPMKQGLGLVYILMFPHFDVSTWFQIKNKFQLDEEDIGNIFLWDFCYRSRLHKIS